MQDEQDVERAREHRVRLVLDLGHLEQHVQEVAGEAEVVVRIDVRPSDAVAERVRGNTGHLRNRAVCLPETGLAIEDLLRIGIETRHRADRADENGHRMRVVLEPLHELLHVLVKHRVKRDLARPGVELIGGRQLAEEDQIGRLEIVAVFGELFNRVSAIEEHALVAVDVRDAAPAVRGVHQRRVVGHHAEVVRSRFDLAQIHRPDGAVVNREVVLLSGAVIDDRQRLAHRRLRLEGWSRNSRWGVSVLICHFHLVHPRVPPERDSCRRPSARDPEACTVRCRTAARRGPPDACDRTRTAGPRASRYSILPPQLDPAPAVQPKQ